MISTEDLLFLRYAQVKAEERRSEDYRRAEDPRRLLRGHIMGIIAVMASSAIDHAQPERPIISEPFGWRENLSRTESRLQTDRLFSQMVRAMQSEIIREVDHYLNAHPASENEQAARIAESYLDGTPEGIAIAEKIRDRELK